MAYVPTEERLRDLLMVAKGADPAPFDLTDEEIEFVESMKADIANLPPGVSIDLPYD